MKHWWRWVRLGWTGVFGYKSKDGNRLRLYCIGEFGPLDGKIVVAWRDRPSCSDEADLAAFLAQHTHAVWKVPSA